MREVPLFFLYGDGTIVGLARVEGIDPKLLPLNRVILTPQERDLIDELVARIRLREVVNEFDTSKVGSLFDGSTITATYTDMDGNQHSYGAYGLTPTAGDDDPPQTVALAELFAGFGSLSWQRDGEEVETTRIQLYLFPGSVGSGEPMEWPLQVQPDDFGSFGPSDSKCLHLTGAAAEADAELLAATKHRSAFTHGERSFYVAARHLLPHEQSCGPEIASFDP